MRRKIRLDRQDYSPSKKFTQAVPHLGSLCNTLDTSCPASRYFRLELPLPRILRSSNMAPSKFSIADYTTLPILLPQSTTLSSLPKRATHTLYLRPHAPKIPTESDARSLFIVNVPIDSTAAHFRAVFANVVGAGKFEDITFEGERKEQTKAIQIREPEKKSNKKRKRGGEEEEDLEVLDTRLPEIWDREIHPSGSSAVAVFVDQKSVELVLKAIKKLHKASSPAWPVWGEGVGSKVPALGSARYMAHHALRYPDKLALQAHVDSFMEAFNNKEVREAEEAKRRRNEPDEDGFVTVTRGGRTGPARQEEAERKRVELEEKQKKEREERERSGFYRWQVRERRKEEQKACEYLLFLDVCERNVVGCEK